MAALDLHRGLEHGACVWAGERLDLLDTFDSEMEEWEQQLQDVQKKIEELYKEVEARRGANEHAPVSGTSHAHLDFTLLPVDAANGCHGPSSCHGAGGKARSAHPCGERRGDALNYHGDYTDDTCGSEAGYHHNGVLCPKSQRVDGGRDVTLDILSGYLRGEESEHSPRSPACPHMVPTRTQSAHTNQDSSKLGPVFGRTGECAEVVGKRNRVLGQDGAPHVSWRDAPSSTQTSQKPVGKPLRQRDVATPLPTHTRSCHVAESPQQPDRKCSLLDRKCGSPSVLRKFGAMLQENEGKTLVQDGTVTTVISADPSKAPATPVCQRKLGGGRASTHTPVQKCPQDPEVRPAGVDARPLPRRPPTGPGSRMRGPQGLEDRDRTLGVCGPQYQGRGGRSHSWTGQSRPAGHSEVGGAGHCRIQGTADQLPTILSRPRQKKFLPTCSTSQSAPSSPMG
ncbi:uncharacterized protein LOC143491286 [Brachyhypopomus gauderio]|uniref:uncharacterized protein LOC143491286 n=1 Tax=Brachyhypopomus gauderio TaxID=698409 RepID=UPI0040437470